MLLVEAGELSLDDLAADRLSPDLEFDTNGGDDRRPALDAEREPRVLRR
jgi:hypothetical protein